MIKVVIYEDQAHLRNALSGLLGGSEGVVLRGAFENCKNVIQEIEVLQPDVVIMDIGLPDLNGIEGLKLIKATKPEIDVIMLTVFEDDDRILQAIQAGASGYLIKNTSPGKIIEAIKDVKAGGAPLTPSVAKKILNTLPSSSKPENSSNSNNHNLSDREYEILSLFAKGYSYKMAASALNLSVDTVRTHVKRSYAKLRVHNVMEAVAKVFGREEEK